MNRSVYITKLASYYPNEAVSNDDIEKILGLINNQPSKARPLILRNNQIKTRYYSFDKEGKTTHTNTNLTRLAIEKLLDENFKQADIELLSCGTTTPDQLLPPHAAMVHGELGGNPVEINTASGSCSAGIQALKFGYLSVLSGNTENAVCTGSERFSKWMQAKFFKEEAEKVAQLEGDGMIAFEKDFLRFMLSDGAAAALLKDKPNADGLSLKIEWIEQRSYAHLLPACMYAGAIKDEAGNFIGWNDLEQDQWAGESAFALKQDTKLLGEFIVKKGGEFMKELVEKKKFDIDKITYFLPHLSSQYFGSRIAKELELLGMNIPSSKWFTNLTWVGNVGAASPLLMLEELFNSGRLKKGDTLWMMIPESARFNYGYIMLTVV
ncbi:beta-ketoacyl-ACP synthase III [Ohtaekwangia koreensis]|jgi:3-oxoacyl-[acyl-carrier-protein] synthase-3|uniref:3-oxoacyl-[acyl-carrier-protein] synthase-3 n=1 Tax=Ohtaekwangia koreensis TaxID=688867 RepID=A0A1T5LMY4_9BACT|nr:beta-ketoacyl-ACP synthase III [Ohtaekwangia koreensis]SKC77347.1 3-oxoacyl-[acyl-carrier-protein] synthase-3 [Ohtaekwangia koreensis]